MLFLRRILKFLAVASLSLAAYPAGAASPQDAACTGCHAAVTQKPVVHAATQMGCSSCHGQLDASAVPHRSKGKSGKGLSADVPGLCMQCHEKKLFEGKVVHGPVTNGQCLGCHNPHASDNPGLLTKQPAALCLDCHPETKKGPHVIAGFSRSGHPLGIEGRQIEDPLRPGKTFYCASCHEPHRADRPKLSRFDKGMTACQKCHKI